MSDPYVVLHGGFHKTATSHIQSILARNSNMLKRKGTYYIHHRDTRKKLTVPSQFNTYIKLGMKWDPVISDEELVQITTEFFDGLNVPDNTRLILSDENLAGHCGHCVKRGLLYRWHKKLLKTFASQIPWTVKELHLSVRNYADFFASAYVEYLRSVSSTWIIDENLMRLQVMQNVPAWHSVIESMGKCFPDATIFVWKYEDFRTLEGRVLSNICGPEINVKNLKQPKDKNKRPTASGRAVFELLQLMHKDGVESALEHRLELQEQFPKGDQFGSYDPWTHHERAHLGRMYERDLGVIEENPQVRFVWPDC
ncbi:hypothetical protein SAMN05444000_10240 [Shimia gijangensis]|uniref:Sulfotransferase family protein n=1 Tax=Shimia gijangensis TaxID=1470563 RepID=A0A1M6CDJ6_9RHOB|nr:hypothetical protein [Shimia gijangensis]SHI59125.1 hypothetical protein SAMN05444000_10240 [Shimia gijangensis]